MLLPGLVYSTTFPTVAIPIKNLLGSVNVTVLIPAEAPEEGRPGRLEAGEESSRDQGYSSISHSEPRRLP